MKKRNVLLALVMSLAMIFASVGSVFAVQSIPDIEEPVVESIAVTVANDTLAGKYKIIKSEDLWADVDAQKNMVIIDAMTENPIIPGAVFAECGSGSGAQAYVWKDGQKDNLIKVVNDNLMAKGLTKKVYVYGTWKKTTKSAYNKVTIKACKKTKRVKGKRYYYKRTRTTKTVVNKAAKIVVYCGFTKCARSHIGAAYLVSKGYTNVYRYVGGAQAWEDAGYNNVAEDGE